MSLSQNGFRDLLIKYLTTLQPVVKNVTTDIEVTKETQSDGRTKLKQTPKKGDVYLPKDFAAAISVAIARAVFEQIIGHVQNPIISKLNELVSQYNQLRVDCISHGVTTTASAVNEIPT